MAEGKGDYTNKIFKFMWNLGVFKSMGLRERVQNQNRNFQVGHPKSTEPKMAGVYYYNYKLIRV